MGAPTAPSVFTNVKESRFVQPNSKWLYFSHGQMAVLPPIAIQVPLSACFH
jgi:hypothetical protein